MTAPNLKLRTHVAQGAESLKVRTRRSLYTNRADVPASTSANAVSRSDRGSAASVPSSPAVVQDLGGKRDQSGRTSSDHPDSSRLPDVDQSSPVATTFKLALPSDAHIGYVVQVTDVSMLSASLASWLTARVLQRAVLYGNPWLVQQARQYLRDHHPPSPAWVLDRFMIASSWSEALLHLQYDNTLAQTAHYQWLVFTDDRSYVDTHAIERRWNELPRFGGYPGTVAASNGSIDASVTVPAEDVAMVMAFTAAQELAAACQTAWDPTGFGRRQCLCPCLRGVNTNISSWQLTVRLTISR